MVLWATDVALVCEESMLLLLPLDVPSAISLRNSSSAEADSFELLEVPLPPPPPLLFTLVSPPLNVPGIEELL